ncbi:MAG TPA: D-alanine--D-alanine ligase, partial [Deltaproteobacteria bacterium]|nr:D-alanine--D-alanine ligase [Deltaproteobacteria bacterium]
KTESHIIETIKELGHHVFTVGIFDKLSPLFEAVSKQKPDIIFNLVEWFDGKTWYDRNIVGLYELLKIRYTGASPPSLMLCKNKALAKQILSYHRIKTPAFKVIPKASRISLPKKLKYPILIKPLKEEASYGISQKSLVTDHTAYKERVGFIHQSLNQDALAEEYVEGREIYVSVLGNQRLQVFPYREMIFGEVPSEEPKFATFKAKWDENYRKRWGIKNYFVKSLASGVAEKIETVCKNAYRHLSMCGYGRLDLRLTPQNEVVIIEANPNPFIAKDEDFALSAQKAGLSYPELVQKILNLGLGLLPE